MHSRLSDRLAELELFGEQYRLSAAPHSYPPGLFRESSFIFKKYIKEIEQDLRQIFASSSSTAQTFLAERITQKIDVLVLSAKHQMTQSKPADISLGDFPNYQQRVDRLSANIHHSKTLIEKLERTFLQKQEQGKSPDEIQGLSDLITKQKNQLTHDETEIRRLRQLPLWQRG